MVIGRGEVVGHYRVINDWAYHIYVVKNKFKTILHEKKIIFSFGSLIIKHIFYVQDSSKSLRSTNMLAIEKKEGVF